MPNEQVDNFRGNLLFATLNTLNFNRPCRKDDLLSLCYLMMSMLSGGLVPFIEHLEKPGSDKLAEIEKMRIFKGKYSLKDMVQSL